MVIPPLTLRKDYWDQFKYAEDDFDLLYNYLLEIETPLSSDEIAHFLISARIEREKKNLESQQSVKGSAYLPKNHYEVGDVLQFPALGWKAGEVTAVRPGQNPSLNPFEVIEVKLEAGDTKQFAASLLEHDLNAPIQVSLDDPNLNPVYVLKKHGKQLLSNLVQTLEANEGLIQIAGRWFPRALLVDISVGHLNLAEAILDMAGGGPMTAQELMAELELPTDVNAKLTEFSLNLALQEDDRFDEVGPSGEVVWYLRRLEPQQVLEPPHHLRFNSPAIDTDFCLDEIHELEELVCDEYEMTECSCGNDDEIAIPLIFPHWRAGTLPLSERISNFFPTAYQSEHIRFSFVDGNSGKQFDGWVIRPSRYIYGLQEWYSENNLIPGSVVIVRKGDQPGQVIIQADKRRQTREWIRTAIVGSDKEIVFSMLKQFVNARFDERMTIAIPDPESVDQLWEQNAKQRVSLEQNIKKIMRELAKLSPQGHVHAQELYAAINLIRRCPPAPIISILMSSSWSHRLGDLYFRYDDTRPEGNAYE